MSTLFSGVTNEQLTQVPLFADLDESTLDDLRKSALFLGAHPGFHVIRRDDAGYQLYVVLSGEAEVNKDGEVVATLKRGDVFGELAILSDRHRNADVVATTVMSMMTLTATEFRRIAETHPEVERRIRALAEERLHS